MLKEEIVVGKFYGNENTHLIREAIEEVDRHHVRCNAFELTTGRLIRAPRRVYHRREMARWADREAQSSEIGLVHLYTPAARHKGRVSAEQGTMRVGQARAVIDRAPGSHTFPRVKQHSQIPFHREGDLFRSVKLWVHLKDRGGSMARKKATLTRRKAAPWYRRLDTIQWAGIGIVVVVLAVGAWLLGRSLQPSKPAASTQTAAKQWTSAPPMTIDKTKQYFATVKMAKGGQFVMQLYPDKAPITVNSFVFLARQGYFDGVTFHRVLDGFMAQGGDPTGTGTGDPGYQFVNEDNDLRFDKAGVVAMANSGRDTNGSQFFITFGPQPQLNGGYTIFGQVTSGMDVVNGLTRRNPDQNPTFAGDAMQSVTIEEK